jgi:mannose-6-phosphate isomerase
MISNIKNLSQCKKTDKPWGYEILWAQTSEYVAKIMNIQAGHRMSLQYHEKKEETLYVMSGFLIVWESENEEDFTTLRPGDIYHVKPGQLHRFGSDLTSDTMVVEVSTNHLDDVVRIKDDYNR